MVIGRDKTKMKFPKGKTKNIWHLIMAIYLEIALNPKSLYISFFKKQNANPLQTKGSEV